ncbi:hypothetical protein HPP92_014944 [Vanilla planifolia]|uniref:DUF6857 domain-containing protein n=1 Tax=Vanilla planifolia TaxID=51239 RepID=A0A835QP86_VANPL|nr:hypothetical protein HPP92_014944 [Vanilla planifolia]
MQEALNRRNAAAIAAAEALEEALSTESILRSLSMFCNLFFSPNTGNPIPAINTFLDIYDDTMKGHQSLHPSLQLRTGKTPADALSMNRANSAKLWVEAALSMDLEVAKLASCISRKSKASTGNYSCSAEGKPGRNL